MGNEKPTKLRDGHALRLMMRSRCTARLPMTIPMAGIIAVTWFEPWHVRFQTCHQRSCPATLDRFRQEAPRVGAGQLSARVGLILACQELSIGESWAGVLVVVFSLVVVRMGIASLAIHGRCDFRVRRAGDGMDQVLSGRRCSECRRRSSHDDNADNRSRYKLSS